MPKEADGMSAVYHNFVITSDRRDELIDYLERRGIETKMHYPILLHLQPAAKSLGYKFGDFPVAEQLNSRQLSLPIYPEISHAEVNYVIENIHAFYAG